MPTVQTPFLTFWVENWLLFASDVLAGGLIKFARLGFPFAELPAQTPACNAYISTRFPPYRETQHAGAGSAMPSCPGTRSLTVGMRHVCAQWIIAACTNQKLHIHCMSETAKAETSMQRRIQAGTNPSIAAMQSCTRIPLVASSATLWAHRSRSVVAS